MLVTAYGNFEGNSWQALCQLVFKRKYLSDGYTEVPDTCGDYGLEGFTSVTGYAYQCYCPDENHDTELMYAHQRDKITTDLKKLKTCQAELALILGERKLSRWHLVTPKLADKRLIAHSKRKEKEVRGWGLSITDPNFSVQLQDAEHYLTEIHEVNAAKGNALNFGGFPDQLPQLTDSSEIFERNVRRKSETRLQTKLASPGYDRILAALHTRTMSDFLQCEGHFRSISRQFPAIHTRLVQLVSEYENEVLEKSATFKGDPNSLTERIKDGLRDRIVKELGPQVSETEAARVTRLTVARWLASCDLDYE